jgi:hypothetical protein
MPIFSKIDSNTNIVIASYYVEDKDVQHLSFPESEPVGIQFLADLHEPNTYWKQTSQIKEFRKNYGTIGCFYDAERDAFIPPPPAQPRTLDEQTCTWIPPEPYPTDGKQYRWNEVNLSWILAGE